MATNALNGKPLGDGVLMAGAIGLASSVGMGAAVKLGGKVLGKVLGRAAEAAESEVAGAADEAESSLASDAEHAGEGGCSFSSDTSVATPSGERAIGTLQVGDHVTAYDPATGKTSTQTVQHVWINHDTDLIDVTLRVTDTQAAATATQKQQEVALRAHGLRAPPVDAADAAAELTAAATTPATQDELIHTTAKHPWLTTDRGFVLAGTLQRGEQVVREDGTPATVVAVAVRPGAADYYNLTVSVLHTYAVGAGRYVVHNCGGADRNLQAMAKALHGALRSEAGDAAMEHLTLGVARRADGSLIVALNQRIAETAGQDLTDVTAQALGGILKRPGWAARGLEYVGPTALAPFGTLARGLAHAEDYLLDQGALDGLETWSKTMPCGRCAARIAAEQPNLL